jgi:ABC-type phosphate/phosphonate transport system permease subunit
MIRHFGDEFFIFTFVAGVLSLMDKLKIFKVLLIVAAILFVAKPFLGYSVYSQLTRLKRTDNIMIKIFSKRKPEFITEAEAKKEFVAQQLARLSATFWLTIGTLLAAILPIVFSFLKDSKRLLHQYLYSVLPAGHTYLLNGKLLI